MSQLKVGIRKAPEVDDTHRQHLRLTVDDLQQSVAHDIGAGINA